ncbi:MAG: hypothetical protein HRU36_03675 [Rickettsiales bacterium]|nr:hypothetical protein [Rickettsiales bacterium]
MPQEKQKSPKAIIKDLRKKADNYDKCITEKSWMKGNMTAMNKALCHFSKLYFDLASFLQDEDDEINAEGINAKHFKTLKEHCKISAKLPDGIIQDNEVVGDISEDHQDL